MKKKPTRHDANARKKTPLPGEPGYPPNEGDPIYSAEDDIYSREKKEPLKEETDLSLSEGLDVPGSELDDADEKTGGEDEENNYYSLGGDNHNDLEEDKGE